MNPIRSRRLHAGLRAVVLLILFLLSTWARPLLCQTRLKGPAQPRGKNIAMTDVVPDSKSVVLRSTHIVRVRVLRFQAGPWELDEGRAFNRRRAVVQFAWIETLKGEAMPPDPPPVVLSVTQCKSASQFRLPVPGVYSLIGPETGKEFVVFSRAHSVVPAEILREQACDQVQPAEDVLTGVRLSMDAMRRDLGVIALLEEARPHAPSLSALFAEFVWERYQREILSAPAAFGAYLSFLEQPALATIARSVLLNDVYSAASNGTRPAEQVGSARPRHV